MSRLRVGWRVLWLVVVVVLGVVLATIFLRGVMPRQGFVAALYCAWHRQVCRIFNAKITLHGDISKDTALFVANHISWFDIIALGGVIPAGFLSKYEVRHWPVIGWLAKRAGTLFIRRGSTRAASESSQLMADVLSRGEHIILFPEGTTTNGRGIKRFHARLYQSAIDAGTLVQPVVIRYPHPAGVHPHIPFIDNMGLLPSLYGLLKEKSICVELHFLEPIQAHGRQRTELARETEMRVRKQIDLDFPVSSGVATDDRGQ